MDGGNKRSTTSDWEFVGQISREVTSGVIRLALLNEFY